MGVQAAIGTDYELDDMFSIFGEIQIDGISYSPTHGKYTVYKLNGKDYLGQLDANDKTWNYLKEIDNTKNIPADQPDEKILINNYFGNFGLIVGVKISIFNE